MAVEGPEIKVVVSGLGIGFTPGVVAGVPVEAVRADQVYELGLLHAVLTSLVKVAHMPDQQPPERRTGGGCTAGSWGAFSPVG